MASTTQLHNWCLELAAVISAKTGDNLRVRPAGSALAFEAAWDDEGTAILATWINLPFPAAKFSRTTTARDFGETIWALIGSWADFNLYWINHQRAR